MKQLYQLLAYFCIQIALVILKLIGLITWSWLIVLIPLWFAVIWVLTVVTIVVYQINKE